MAYGSGVVAVVEKCSGACGSLDPRDIFFLKVTLAVVIQSVHPRSAAVLQFRLSHPL